MDNSFRISAEIAKDHGNGIGIMIIRKYTYSLIPVVQTKLTCFQVEGATVWLIVECFFTTL